MITITLSEKVNVPESDIVETISAIENFFKTSTKESITVGMFGYNAWEVNKNSVEINVRECASVAKPYTK